MFGKELCKVKKNLKINLLLTLSYVYTYEIPKLLRLLYVYIRVHTDFVIEIWGFYWRLTDTLRYQLTRCSRASGLWHPLVSMFTKSEEKWSLLGVVRCFWRVLENYDCRTKFNSSLGMEYNRLQKVNRGHSGTLAFYFCPFCPSHQGMQAILFVVYIYLKIKTRKYPAGLEIRGILVATMSFATGIFMW